MKRVFTSLLLTALLAVSGSAWALSQVDGVYQIASAADLLEFKGIVESGEYTANALVTANIDMDGQGWAGICIASESDAEFTKYYSGTFDGGGNAISNLGAPLFSKTANGVTVKNLTLDGTPLTTAPGNNFAAFIADARGTGFTLTNLTNRTAISVSNNNVGAFVGYCNITSMATLTNCVNEANIAGGQNVGGLVGQQGYSDATLHLAFQDCANKGDVSGTQRSVAGIIGHTQCRTNYTDTYNEGKITSTANSVGGILGRCSRGWQYFTRCHNSGAVSGTTQVAGIFADYDRYNNLCYTTFEDCYNEGDVTGTGDNVGGFLGRGNADSDSPFVLTRCYNTGKISSVAKNRPGTLIQWTNAKVTITDCWNIGEIACTDGTYTGSGVNTLSNTGTVTNSYDFANADLTPSYGRPEGYEDAWMTNGHFCYFLNGNSSESPVWYQTLGDDQHPVLDNTRGVVYGVAAYKCDGVTAKGDVSYSNVNTSVVDAHAYADGICSECGEADLAYLTPNGDGFYEIGTVRQLQWFAGLVNVNKETAAKGKLTADIDMDGKGWTGITGFKGTFDGDSHKISNLGAPLFATTASGVTIQNLTLEGALTVASGNDVGAFIANHNGARINMDGCVNKTNVTATESDNVGAFIGQATLGSNAANKIQNCVNEGSVSGKNAVGAIIGNQSYSSGSGTECLNIEDCVNKGDISGTSNVGGLIGLNNAMINYTRSSNEGTITGTAEATGGLIGRCSRGWQYFRHCHNSGDVNGSKYVAGFMGDYNRGGLSFTNLEDCYNEGTVRGDNDNIGGLLGRATVSTTSEFKIERCYNTGDVYGAKAYRPRALFHWTNAKVTIADSWNIGEVKCIDGEFTDNDVYTMTYLANYSNLTLQNSYELANAAMTPKTGTPAGYEDAWLANGGLAYYINNEAGNTIYYQTIGTDAHPVFAGEEVYKTSNVGWATFYDAENAYAFVGVKAYTGKVNGEYLTLTEVSQANAGTPVILEGSYYNKVAKATPAEMPENDLKGAATDIAADGSQYVLAVKDEVVGFYQAIDGTIAAGKAYLTGISAGVKGITFGTTSLTPTLSEEKETVIYDLSGRRVEKAVKGLYIINGTKVLK